MDAVASYLAHLPRSVWVALGVPIGLAMLARAGRRPVVVIDGWTELRSSVLLYMLAAFALALAVLFLLFGFLGLTDPSAATYLGPHPRILAGGAIVFGVMFPYAAATTFFRRIRFSADGVERAWFGRTEFFPWGRLTKFDRSTFIGPRFVLNDGRSLPVSEYLRGFSELMLAAEAKAVKIAEEFRR